MITRDRFIKALEVLNEQQRVDWNFGEHMRAAFPGSYAPIYHNLLWDLSINLLEQLVEDPYKYISWWIFETDFGKEEDMTEISWTENGQEKSVQLTSADKLYDFLVDNAINNPPSDKAEDTNCKSLSLEDLTEFVERKLFKNKQ